MQAVGIRDNGSIFEVNRDEARMMDITSFLEDLDIHYYGDNNLYRHLPSPWSPAYWRDEEWNSEYHVAKWILGQQECFVTQGQIEEFIEAYDEYGEDAKKKVHEASKELSEMRYWLQAAVVRRGLQ